MTQTVGQKFTFDQLSEILHASKGSFSDAKSFEQQAYLESVFPLEVTSNPVGLEKKFSDIEDRLRSHVGEPIVCIRDGDVTFLYMGIVGKPEILFHIDHHSQLPRGSASVQVEQLQIAVVIIDDWGRADIEILPTPNGVSASYFQIEERAFRKLSDTEEYECVSSDWDLLIGNTEIDRFFGQSRLILPVRQGITPALDLGVIDVTGNETQGITADYGITGR